MGRSGASDPSGVGQSLGAVATTLGRARAAGLDWAQVQALTDGALEERLYGPKAEGTLRPMPEFEYLHAERKKPGVTLELLHLEYLEKQPDGYRYTSATLGAPRPPRGGVLHGLRVLLEPLFSVREDRLDDASRHLSHFVGDAAFIEELLHARELFPHPRPGLLRDPGTSALVVAQHVEGCYRFADQRLEPRSFSFAPFLEVLIDGQHDEDGHAAGEPLLTLNSFVLCHDGADLRIREGRDYPRSKQHFDLLRERRCRKGNEHPSDPPAGRVGCERLTRHLGGLWRVHADCG